MKTFNSIIIAIALLSVATACDNKFSSHTVVHPDGSLDKTFLLEQEGHASQLLNLNEKNGWKKTTVALDSSAENKNPEYRLTFQKTFTSADAANAELASGNDTLFQIESSFNKKFRWFYTYIRYADTYKAINRLKYPTEDFLTPEDFA